MTDQRRQLPPYTGLRAFEAAARHLSFKRAADELSVTQSAISHGVKSLEAFLGVELFYRANNTLRLTDDGQNYLPDVQQALDQISSATARLRSPRRAVTVTLGLNAVLANRWLIPRLSSFRAAYPEIEVEILTIAGPGPVDFARSTIDLCILYHSGPMSPVEGMHSDLLMREEVLAVCSPSLIGGETPLSAASDLAGHTLLHNTSVSHEWERWLRAVGAEGVDSGRGPRFQTSDLVLHAAEAGVGVALGRRPMVDAALDKGALVAPLEFVVLTDVRFYLVYPADVQRHRKIQAFHRWLLAQVDPAITGREARSDVLQYITDNAG